MRIAYLNADFGVRPFGGSGGSVHVRETVRALRRIGHEVDVFAPDLGCDAGEAPEGYHEVPLEGLGRETVRRLSDEPDFRSSHVVREWRRMVYAEQLQRALGPRFASAPPDAFYERYSLFAYAGLELARRSQRPFLLEVNAPLCHEASTHRGLVLRETAEALEQHILSGADTVFVVSDELALHARKLGVPAERIQVLPNGVDPERFRPVSGEGLRARLGLEGLRLVGFVGSPRPWHDLETLIEATRLLHASDPRVRLLLVGQGRRLDELRVTEEPFIVCAGAVPHESVPEALAAMDVVAVPYAKHGDAYFSPLKLFEAMAAGRPVVGARAGQVAQVLRHGDNGLLYEPGQAEDLAERVRSLLERPAWANELGSAARSWVIEHHSWESNARRIADAAQACLAPQEPAA